MTMRVPALLVVVALLALAPWPRTEELRSGLDVSDFDRKVAPQDDLYRHVNAGWLDRTAMPTDRVTYGAFAELADKTSATFSRSSTRSRRVAIGRAVRR